MRTDKHSRKRAATGKSRGKASYEKGVKFQDAVADLYRLLGAEVIPNIQICGKKVDILATFRLPGSPGEHRVIVECKNEKKAVAQNQRVMQFKGLLGTARKAGEADSAEVITRVPWSEQAKGFARESGVTLVTYTEKMAQLIDFTSYLNELVYRFDKGSPEQRNAPPLGAYYIDLCAERTTKERPLKVHVTDYIQRWLHDVRSEQQLAILGEYGMGKTSLCQKLARDQAAFYLKAPDSNRIPLLFNLREFTKALKIEALVSSFLDEECGAINPRFRLFQAMNDAGNFLLIFDGFDEMAARVDMDILEMNLQEIEKLAGPEKSKVIITSRPEYFVSAREERRSLHPKAELLPTRETEYEPLRILPWDDKQVSSFLSKRVSLSGKAKHHWTYYRDAIGKIPGLSDLSRRPVLLDMVVRTLPQLITTGKPINRANVYEIYLLGEMRRQKVMKKRSLLVSHKARFSLLQHLAKDFCHGDISSITFDDALKYVDESLKPPGNELEAYTRDFLTCSFLVRKGDKYRFSHTSIMEYLVAKAFMDDITRDKPEGFARQPLSSVVAEFLAELSPDTGVLWESIELTKRDHSERIKYLGGNSATVLCRLDATALAGKNLSGTNLSGADLSFADLRDANLEGTVMREVNLMHAKFLRKDLKNAELSDFTVSVWILTKGAERKRVGAAFEAKIIKLLKELGIARVRARATLYGSGGLFLDVLTLQVSDTKVLELIRSKALIELPIQSTSVHDDECDWLFKGLPKDMKASVSKYLSHVHARRVNLI